MPTSRRILVVDDEPAIRTVLVQSLCDEGFDVAEAHNGQEALELARQALPDVILLDLSMPVMDGTTFLAESGSTDELTDIPLIVLSAEPGLADLEAGPRVRDKLAQPFDMDVLLVLVEQVLAHPEPPPDTPTVGA